MSRERATPRSRRSVLAAAAGAAAASVAATVARPLPALAGTDGDLVLGAENTSAEPTVLRLTGENGAALNLESVSNGLEATVDDGVAIGASSRNGYAISGVTADGIGVLAEAHPFDTAAPDSSGVALVT